jgi:hypothetical protein
MTSDIRNSRQNVGRTVQCIFKKVYTVTKFSVDVNPCNNTKSLYNQILDIVHRTMFDNRDNLTINDFELVLAGSGEQASAFLPNNSCIKTALDFVDYERIYSLYVREKVNVESQCPICYENIGITNRFQCSHRFCNYCTNSWLNTCILGNRIPNCPICRSNLLR